MLQRMIARAEAAPEAQGRTAVVLLDVGRVVDPAAAEAEAGETGKRELPVAGTTGDSASFGQTRVVTTYSVTSQA